MSRPSRALLDQEGHFLHADIADGEQDIGNRALQDGAVGDVIKVRNSDSGVTVSGAVQPDGTVRVSGG